MKSEKTNPSSTANDSDKPQHAPDPFDAAALRIDAALGASPGVKQALLRIPVRKPSKQEFFRVRAGAENHLHMAVLELKEEGEVYALAPSIAAALPGDFRRVDMRVCITRSGMLLLWPLPLPAPDGRENSWHTTARAAAELAETQWLRLVSNMGAGAYDVYLAQAGIPDPEWPTESLTDLLRVAFGNGRLIDTLDHPVIRRLLGR